MAGAYKDLRVWQQAMELAVHVYGATETFPKSELYGLMNQMRRALFPFPATLPKERGIGQISSSSTFCITPEVRYWN